MRKVVAGLLSLAIFVAEEPGLAARDTPAQPDSVEGLEKLVKAIQAATVAQDMEELSGLIRGLVLPDHEAWFKRVFGEEIGARLAADYGERLPDFDGEFGTIFALTVGLGENELLVRRFEKAGERDATGEQNDAMAAMKEAVALYSVHLTAPGAVEGLHVWSFVYADDGFRFVGKLDGVGRTDDASSGTTRREGSEGRTTRPRDLKYSETDVWVRVERGDAVVGITDCMVKVLGSPVHLGLPEVGDTVKLDAPFGELESAAAISDLISPITGKVVAVNGRVLNIVDLLVTEPYWEGWLIRVRLDHPAELDSLMTADEYEKRTGSEDD